jgi:hypothetical protein
MTTITATTSTSIKNIFLLFLIISLNMSSSQSFFTQLEKRIEEINSHLCVGLDPHLKELFPDLQNDGDALAKKTEGERCDAAYTFCKNLIDATG